jgi:hypothetical protein
MTPINYWPVYIHVMSTVLRNTKRIRETAPLLSRSINNFGTVGMKFSFKIFKILNINIRAVSGTGTAAA